MSLTLPDILASYLRQSYGEPLSIELLGGKSGATVYRVSFAAASLIIKASTSSTESRFYQQVAPAFRTHDVPLPALEASFIEGETFRLLLEDIPHPLPRDEWHGHSRLITILARLHRLPLEILPANFGSFIPSWTGDLTDKALACFPDLTAAQLCPILETIRREAQSLFLPQSLISGDPNPGNWGVRDDGSLVLFDWERFTCAAPAIDLAIIVAGLGSRAQFRTVAETYLTLRPEYPLSASALTDQIILAKIWVVIEYLSLYTDQHLAPDALLQSLTGQIPAWLQSFGFLA